MKLISPKTLLASLVGVIIIIIKVINFDGIDDLFWIVFLGYLTLKGFHVAFSEEAHEEDLEQAYQGKALYSALFGRFAYVAGYIPLILILLAGLLAFLCPDAKGSVILLWLLLIVALGYAIWFSWYVSKHKKEWINNGKWGTAVLCAEQEKAWRRYNIFHNIALGIMAILGIGYIIFGDPRIFMNNAKLKGALTSIDSDSITLEEAVPFEWTTVYTFDPYTSIERIEWITGSKSPALKESVNEGMTHFVFMNRGRVTASVCAYPSNVGYDLYFTGGEYTYYDYRDGGYSHIEYGDLTLFEVTQEEGIVRLYAYVEE